MTVTDGSQIDGNSNNGPGGGIAANFEGAVTISDGSQVDGNTGAGLGGGIVNFSDTFGINVIGQSQVADNHLTNVEDAIATSGLISVGLDPAVERAFVSGGRGDADVEGGTPTVRQRLRSASSDDRAGRDNAFPSSGTVEVGGGICSVLSGPIEVSGGSDISDNRFASKTAGEAAIGDGGGVFANIGPITIDGSTISGNTATGDGGGIWNGSFAVDQQQPRHPEPVRHARWRHLQSGHVHVQQHERRGQHA